MQNSASTVVNLHWSSCKLPVILRIFMGSKFSWPIFEKCSCQTNFMKILLVETEFSAVTQTDWHDEGNICFSQFGKHAQERTDYRVIWMKNKIVFYVKFSWIYYLPAWLAFLLLLWRLTLIWSGPASCFLAPNENSGKSLFQEGSLYLLRC